MTAELEEAFKKLEEELLKIKAPAIHLGLEKEWNAANKSLIELKEFYRKTGLLDK